VQLDRVRRDAALTLVGAEEADSRDRRRAAEEDEERGRWLAARPDQRLPCLRQQDPVVRRPTDILAGSKSLVPGPSSAPAASSEPGRPSI